MPPPGAPAVSYGPKAGNRYGNNKIVKKPKSKPANVAKPKSIEDEQNDEGSEEDIVANAEITTENLENGLVHSLRWCFTLLFILLF